MRITDAERRARLVARHHLGCSAADVLTAVRGVVALHSSDPLTPHLAARARVPGFATGDLDRALLQERTLWRLHAMRRTLFVVPADGAAIFQAAASDDIARKERSKVEGWVAAAIRARSIPRWLAKLEDRVLAELADGSEQRTTELCEAIPELGTSLMLGSGKWATEAPLSSRLLFVMALEGRIVRTRAAGSWRSSQYAWASTTRWWDRARPPLAAADARVELARWYLGAHGPATLVDLRWWTGWTAKQASTALAALDARAVSLDGGGEGYVLSDDPPARAPKHVALLPGLDPTPMGWKERGWFLGDHAPRLFDTNGNVGPTVWVDGRIVGGWAVRDGKVVHRLLEALSKTAAARVTAEIKALTAWLDGETVCPRFRTPLERQLSSVR